MSMAKTFPSSFGLPRTITRDFLPLRRSSARRRPDVIFTTGTPGVTAAANATTAIPIIVGPAGEETLMRLAGNLARPTGNVTGFTLNSAEQEFKCLQFLKEVAPRASRVAVLLNPDNPNSRDHPGILAPAATQLGLTLITSRSSECVRPAEGVCRYRGIRRQRNLLL